LSERGTSGRRVAGADDVTPVGIQRPAGEVVEAELIDDGDGEMVSTAEPLEILDGEVLADRIGGPVGPVEPVDDVDEDEDEEANVAGRRRRALLDWVIVIGVALLVAFLVRTFVLAHFVVDGTSMVTTLHDGDRVFVNKLSYRLHDPNRGDVVVLHQITGASERDLIKRVIALPGETIEIRSCQVLIDGRLLEEPYLDPEVVTPGNCGGELAPVTVPDDHVFVMGDNRGGSQDSRALGPIDEDDLVGRAFVVFWPRADWQWL
jgi:signal peptidase I